MKTTHTFLTVLFIVLLFATHNTMAQQETETENSTSNNPSKMKTYLIEREISNAGKLTPEELKAISQKSCSVLKDMGPQIKWENSYVSGDKIYCIYKAESEALVKEHAQKGGFSANTIVEISTIISPATAN